MATEIVESQMKLKHFSKRVKAGFMATGGKMFPEEEAGS
jgi:hypothetical protein